MNQDMNKGQEHRNFGQKKFSDNRRSFAPRGEKKDFSGNNERRPYAPRGEKKDFSGNNERRPYAPRGEKKDFGTSNERRPYAPRGEKKDFGTNNERRPFAPGGEKRGFENRGERRPFPNHDGNRPAFGRPAGDRKPFGRPVQNQNPQAPASGGRRVALEVLQDVFEKDGYASLVLDQHLQTDNLPQVEKRFCANLVYSTLENLIRIDYALASFLEDVDSLEKRVRTILRMSVCQLMYMDRVPSSAVVDEAVKLTRFIGLESMTGLVNGVLRNYIRDTDKVKWPKPEEGAHYLSVMFSVPEWLAEKLMGAYGPETAQKICSYRGKHAMTLRPNRALITDEQFEKVLEKKVWNHEKAAVLDAWHVTGVSQVARDSDYLGGMFSIEGESSMLAAEAVQAKPGMQILDCCAAPGGKTAYIAESMKGTTGRVYAWDVHDHRVALIRAMMKRLHLDNVRPAVRDAVEFREDLEGQMDAVLLDAPCSGLGVMDDKPDLKYRVTKESVEELKDTQEKLLETCCKYVKKGGTLVYSTCSLLPEENKDQIEKFLKKHDEFKMIPLPENFPEGVKERYSELGVQILPHLDQLEGFYIARMKRV